MGMAGPVVTMDGAAADGAALGTPPLVPGPPPELVPFDDDDDAAASASADADLLAAAKAATPEAKAAALRAADLKMKAFTPAPEKRRVAAAARSGAATPQPKRNDEEDAADCVKAQLFGGEQDAAPADQVAAAAQQQQQQQQQQAFEGDVPALEPQPEPQPQQQQQQLEAPGVLYPVFDNGKLVGYMAVPSQDLSLQGASEPPAPMQMDYAQQMQMQPQQQHHHHHNLPHQQQLHGHLHQQQQLHQLHGHGHGGHGGGGPMHHALAEMNTNQMHNMGRQGRKAGEGHDWHDPSGLDILALRGKVVDVAKDHAGSRALQRRLDRGCTDEEKQLVFEEVEPKCAELMVHMFGNYVVQKIFEHGLPQHVQLLSERLRGHVLALSLSPYGCRVIQKALEASDASYKAMVVQELTGQVPRCVQDQNGNHVIQKCIETMPESVGFIVSAFRSNVHNLAMHAYGCRVIQRLLEFCKNSVEVAPIIEEILAAVDQLVGDRYGNYVVQHVIINGEKMHRAEIFGKLRGSTLALARGKFSSNVVEKMFEYGSHRERSDMLAELLLPSSPDGTSGLLAMVQDPFANYVVQKMLDCCDHDHQRLVTDHIRPHLVHLRKFNYGKHIISRLERAGMSLGHHHHHQQQPQQRLPDYSLPPLQSMNAMPMQQRPQRMYYAQAAM